MNGNKFLAKRFQENIEIIPKFIHNKNRFIDLSIGDLDVHTDKNIIHSAFEDALKGHTHYKETLGDFELRQEILKYHKNEFINYNLNLNQIMVTSGGCHGMYLALRTTLNPLDEVIILAPFFPVYEEQIKEAMGVPIIVNTFIENNYQIIKNDLEKVITKRTKGIIVNTPCNPTGVCYTIESLKIICEISKKYDLLVYADDIYDFYDFSKTFIPIYTLEDMSERTISICSFSKNFAMTGWRIGYNIAPEAITNSNRKLNELIIYSACSISQRAAIYALKNVKHTKETLAPLYKSRIEYCLERVNKIDFFKTFHPQGGIYLFVNISKTGLKSVEYSNYLFENLGIKVIPGKIFGDDNAIRISCSKSLNDLKEAFDRIEKDLSSMSKRDNC
ncbi:MAG: aminotransferase class I/II-fold pyridoxal phosphate-dependent enzyme [Fusobacteriaceae bacterium]